MPKILPAVSAAFSQSGTKQICQNWDIHYNSTIILLLFSEDRIINKNFSESILKTQKL